MTDRGGLPPAPDRLARDGDRLAELVLLAAILLLTVAGTAGLALAGAGTPAMAIFLAAGLAALAAGWQRSRRHAARLQSARQCHRQQLALLAEAVQGLSRLRSTAEIVAGTTAIGRTLLSCEHVELRLGPPAAPAAADLAAEPADPDAPAAIPPHCTDLAGTGGEPLGGILVSRADGAPLTAEALLALAQFAAAVAAALERAALLDSLHRAQAELQLTLAGIGDGVLVLDDRWRIRMANPAAAACLRCRPEALAGAELWAVSPGLHASPLGERLAAASIGATAFTGLHAPLHAWLELRAAPYAGGVVAVLRDVTVQLHTEDKLRQVQRREALGHLAGGVAHDVNNLLTVILGNLELLAMRAQDRPDSGPEPEAERELDLTLAAAGLRAGESASQLMHRLLAFSRRQAPAPQVVAVSELLRSLQPLLRRTMSEQVSLRMHWPPGLWHTLVDPAELESAILNLSINAQDAMPGGGTLSIEAANIAAGDAEALAAGLGGERVMIAVSDTGTGMPTDVAARAFDAFFTTKAPGKGSGLGLSTVAGFVRQAGGEVRIDSQPGQGTAVRFYLPRALPPPPVPPVAVRPLVAGGSESILLVEDNDLVRAHTEAMLRGLGYAVAAAADGPAALRLLAGGWVPDLLLTDVILPGGMTGRDVAEAAQRDLAGLRVLYISGYSGDVLMENGRLPPGVDLLAKPFRRSELAARVRARLDGAA